MKVGILTYQNTLNFGAALQSYALFVTIEKFGADTEIIDYRNNIIEKSLEVNSFVTKRGKNKLSPLGLMKMSIYYPLINSKKKAFSSFNSNYLKLSKSPFFDNESFKKSNLDYDKYIIGSDQLWNYEINGMDTTYFLNFIENRDSIFTYATSFGLDKISESFKNDYISNLNSLPNISVREAKGAQLIYDLTGKEVEIMPDPVFLIDMEDWLKIINQDDEKNHMTDSICTYFLNNNTRVKFEKELKNNKQISSMKRIKLAGGIKVKDYLNLNVSVKYSNGPLDYLKKIVTSKYIFTDSFHATVFSIIFKKNFIVFLSGKEGRDSRIIDLLKTFNMSNRIYDGNFKALEDKIDDSEIDLISTKIKQKAVIYLKKNMI